MIQIIFGVALILVGCFNVFIGGRTYFDLDNYISKAKLKQFFDEADLVSQSFSANGVQLNSKDGESLFYSVKKVDKIIERINKE